MSMKRKKLSLPEVKAVFSSEYSSLLGKFDIHDLTLDKVEGDTSLPVNSPGIYVFWNEEFGVIKVGKSQSNSKVRSLQHIRDNTRNDELEMKSLKSHPKTHLILFNILLKRDMHWLLGLELYMEQNLFPLIPAGRVG